ncbi:MAG: phage minor head protein [Acidithiobacillus sp.]|nr:phage minor head protein [Acidithiobacillus sp.]
MPTLIDKSLFDYAIHEQISTHRYANQQVQDIVGLLNEADRELLAKIHGIDDINKLLYYIDHTVKVRGKETVIRNYYLREELKAIVDAAYWQAETDLHKEMGGFALHVADSTEGMLATQLPIAFKTVSVSPDQLKAILSNDPIKIGKDGADLFSDIFAKLAGNKVDDIRKAIRLGMVQGETTDQITRRLKGTRAAQYRDGILEGSRRDMANLVRTTTNFVGNQSALMTFQANSEVVSGWVDVASLDGKTCNYCWSRSGRVYSLNEDGPPWHVSCRCFKVPRVRTWKELGFDNMPEYPVGQRASSSGPVPADISFESWVRTQNKSAQVELLGPTRQKLFAAGGLKLDKFTDNSGQLYTLADLKGKHAKAFKKAFGG